MRLKVLNTHHLLEKARHQNEKTESTQRLLIPTPMNLQWTLLVPQSYFPRFGLLGAYSTKQTWRRNAGGKTEYKWFHDLEINTSAFCNSELPRLPRPERDRARMERNRVHQLQIHITELTSLDTTIRLLNMHRSVAEIKTHIYTFKPYWKISV